MSSVTVGVLLSVGLIFSLAGLLLAWSLCAMSSRLDDADDAEALAALAAERIRAQMAALRREEE